MNTVLNNKGYGILRSELTSEKEKFLLEDLTVKPFIHPDYDFNDNNFHSVYRFNSTRYYVPKYWGIKHYGIPKKITQYKDNKEIYEFKGKRKDYQIDFSNLLLKELTENGSCLGVSGTGSGKTVMMLWLMAQLNSKTLIVVNKETLLDQWIKRINQYLPNTTIGIIRQNTAQVDKQIVIGLIQSITQHEYPEGTFDGISFTIFDECHHLPSRVFSKAFYLLSHSKYMIGITATPERKDGLSKVLEWFLGNVVINLKDSDVDVPVVKFIESKYTSELKPKYNWKKNLIIGNMETQIANDQGRTTQIVNETIKISKEGRKILILSSRIEHCKNIKNQLCDHPLFNKLKTVGLYIGGMKESQLTESNKCDVIVATYNMAYEGYDNPELDTLIMATSKSDIKQACGRILRQRNNYRPLIIDFIDSQYFGNQLKRRKEFYMKNNYIDYESMMSFKDIKKLNKKKDINDNIISDECLL